MKHIFSKKNRALLSELVRTDFKLRYQGSFLGYTWSLLRPLLLFTILYIVFAKFLKLGRGIEHYPVYLLLGIVMWSFFSEMTNQGLSSIVSRGSLIRKIKIPRWMIVLTSSISALINFSLNLIIVAVFMAINGVDVSWGILLLPLIFLQVYLLGLGASLFLAAAFVKYRDISFIWEVIMQGAFYLTPIIYPVSLIPSLAIQKLIFLNPMAQAIQNARYVAVTQDTVTAQSIFGGKWYAYIPYAITLIVLIVGTVYFKRQSKYFAENI